MATAKEMRLLIGATIRYSSERTRMWALNEHIVCTGIVEDQAKTETYINGDWHNTKSIEVIEQIKES